MNPFRDAMRYQENRSKQSKGYWLVLVKTGNSWGIHFGDYVKAVARQEFHDLSLPDTKAALVQSPSDLQEVLDGIVKAWNTPR